MNQNILIGAVVTALAAAVGVFWAVKKWDGEIVEAVADLNPL